MVTSHEEKNVNNLELFINFDKRIVRSSHGQTEGEGWGMRGEEKKIVLLCPKAKWVVDLEEKDMMMISNV